MMALTYDPSAEYFKIPGFKNDIYRIETAAFSAQSVDGISYPELSTIKLKKDRGSDGKYYPHVDYKTGALTFLTRQVPLNVIQAFDVVLVIYFFPGDGGA